MEDYASRIKNSDTDDDIENEATKVEVGDNFAIITEKLENGDPFLLFCVIRHYNTMNQCLKMVGGMNGMRAICF
jgi:hypothetical protein